MTPAAPLRYRAEIDGLRAIAVVAVMLYHADPRWLPGGFAGVDVFFVISGYLITRTIADDRAAGRFTLAGFWERRARRILPALLLVMAVFALAALALMTPDELRGYAAGMGASTLFAGNLYFWRGSGGYFALAADRLPLLHLWSLGVEEQFYLLYPPVLAALWRWRPRWLFAAVVAGLAASLALSIAMTARAPVAGFFLLPARGWELLAGAALALRPAGTALPRRAALPAGLAALAAILATFALLTPITPFPGIAAIPLVAGTAVLIAVAPASPPLGRLRGWRPLVGIGLISYGAYLWHHPLLAFARVVQPDALTGTQAAALLVASLLLAWFSWRWVERPMRRRADVPARAFWWLTGSGIALLLGLSAAILAGRGLPQRLPAALRPVAALGADSAAAMDPCFFPPGTTRRPEAACLRGTGGAVRVAILGDSHAAALAPGLDPLLARTGSRARLLIAAGCPPSLADAAMSALQAHCPAHNRRMLAWLLADADTRLVMIAARWPYYVRRTFYDNGEGGVERGPEDGLAEDASRTRALGDGLAAIVRPLLRAGKAVLVVDAVPEPGWDVPRHIVHGWQTGGTGPAPTIDAARWFARAAPARALLDRLGHHPRLYRIDPAPALCPRAPRGRCRLTRNGQPLFFDDDHPTADGARLMLDGPARTSSVADAITGESGR